MNSKGKVLAVMLEMNSKLAADALSVKLGDEACKLIMAPMQSQLPKEMLPLAQGPLGKILLSLGIEAVSANYNITGLDTVSRFVSASTANSIVNCLGDLIAKMVTRESEVLALPAGKVPAAATLPPSSMAAHNKAKGNQNVSGFLKVEAVASQIKANTTTGGEAVIEGELVDDNDTPPVYWPVTHAECEKDASNKLRCGNPLGHDEHYRQKDKINAYVAANNGGFRDDLNGLMICGGCRDELHTLYKKEKKAKDEADAKEKALAEAQDKIDAMTVDYDVCCKALEKAQASRVTFLGLVKDDPTNEDYVASLASVEAKVKTLTDQKKKYEDDMLALEMLLDEAVDGNVADASKGERSTPVNTPPVVHNNVASGPKPEVQVIVPGNAKVSVAADRIKNGKKHNKK